MNWHRGSERERDGGAGPYETGYGCQEREGEMSG